MAPKAPGIIFFRTARKNIHETWCSSSVFLPSRTVRRIVSHRHFFSKRRRNGAHTLSDETSVPPSKLFSKAEPLPFEKAINNNLVYSSCLKHAKEMLLGDKWQADHRPANAKLPLPHCHSSITRPCCSSAKLLVFTCTRALDRLRTRRRVGSTRRRGNHMHDHSRFQRDID